MSSFNLFFKLYDMGISKLVILTLLALAHTRFICPNTIPTLHHQVDSVAISCGFSGRVSANDGRAWFGDVGSIPSSFLQLSGKSTETRALHQASTVDPTPFSTARVYRHEFTYTFHVQPGQKFIRLHFSPAAYRGFKKSKAMFSVKAGWYTLLTNFNPAAEAEALGVTTLIKEFCVNIPENQALNIVFSPLSQAEPKENYAFINGIEIVYMPAGLYFTRDSDLGAKVVGQNYKFYIDNSTALEMVKRLNIGGNSIASIEDASMFRGWDDDSYSLSPTDSVSIDRNIRIQYKDGPAYIAPMKVYQSARTARPENQLNNHNLTWNIYVDIGFRYLVRLHFCELESEITENGEREFIVLINNQIAENNVDIVKWGGGQGVALYQDYVVILGGNHIGGKHNLVITLQPKLSASGKQADGILNGLEIFKLSNPDHHLTSKSHITHLESPTSWLPKHKQLLSTGSKNATATILTVIITSLNIVVYYLRRLSERDSGARSVSSPNHGCRHFSLDEIRSTTNNFHPSNLIGSGGYGKVYKGRVDNGATIVAIKRLKSESKQGENEFRTEIDMLSKLRHENLVSLIGYCDESQEMLLIYQYMKRGTLDDHLYKIVAKGKFNPPLSWEQRLKILIGAARGLNYLHQQRVIHRDVKSSNILLDEIWEAKISDFGLSKKGPATASSSHVSTEVKGTFGYLDPEYFLTSKLTMKSDVYAFGVVLFEGLTGRPAVDMRLGEEQHSLAAWARNCIKKGNLDQIIDPTLMRQISPACLKIYIDIAQRSLHPHPETRPTMFDVVRHLESALILQQSPHSEEVIEVGQMCDDESDGNASLNDSESPTGRTSTTSTEGDISTASMEIASIISETAKDRLEEKVLSSTVSSYRWWNLFRFFLKRISQKGVVVQKGTSQLPEPDGCRKFSFHEILRATNNFRNGLTIGWGRSETVCKGHIDGGHEVVVIRRSYLEEERHPTMQDLQLMLGMSNSGSHARLASLIGYYGSKNDVVLVFDGVEMANTNLHNHLHNHGKDPLSWKQRLLLLIEASRVLHCLHALKIETAIQFWNLTSANILIDERWVAKIDLYLAAHNISRATSTRESDFIRDEQAREKCCVFSFGIILFEVICAGEKSRHWLEMDQARVAQWLISRPENNCIRNIDPYLMGKISPESFRIFMETASRCLHPLGKERPSLSDIVSNLETALKLQEAAEENQDLHKE